MGKTNSKQAWMSREGPEGDCVIENDTTNTALDFPEDELVTEKSIYTAEYTYKGYPVNLYSDEIVHYKQWVTVDRTTLQDCSMPIHDFLEALVDKTNTLTTHHFIAKYQSKYLSDLKENLADDELIMILDFAENYSFIVQDAAQGFHWDNSQATLHPFVAYFKKDGLIQHTSMCVISDYLKHDTVTVHRFLQEITSHLKSTHPELKKYYYFTDGAASQYKNFKNFCNLTFHKEDFDLAAEWHFFATSHGKNACDGVGGTIKREASKASLQAAVSGHILTPRDLFEWSQAHIENVTFFYISKEEVVAHVEEQEERFANAKTVAGTRSHHGYIPIEGSKKLLVQRISGDNEHSFEAAVYQDEPEAESRNGDGVHEGPSLKDCEIGKFVGCLYDGKWWVGHIRGASEEEGDVLVSFMHPHGPARSFHWPEREDTCYVPMQCILCFVNAPSTPNGRQYYLDKADKDYLAQAHTT